MFKKFVALLLACSLLLPSLAEARAGESSSGHGYGGTYQRPSPSYQYNRSYNPQPTYRTPQQPYGQPASYPAQKQSGGFMSGLFSGILGTYLYKKIFGQEPAATTATTTTQTQKNYPQSTAAAQQTPVFSFWRILLLLALVYLIWHMVKRKKIRREMENQQTFNRTAPPTAPQQSKDDFFNLGRGTETQQQAIPAALRSEDFQSFENLLLNVQDAWSHNNLNSLGRITTPQMYNNFANIMRENQQQNVANSISQVKVLNQEVQETWQDEMASYAKVAITWSAIDYMFNTSLSPNDPGYLVDGSLSQPSTVTEVWTFKKESQGPWVLADIQQVG